MRNNLLPVGCIWMCLQTLSCTDGSMTYGGGGYDPAVIPENFTTEITNKYFALPPGKVLNYESKTDEGTQTTRIEVLDESKMIMGVETIVYWDQVWVDGKLIEDTRDYLAQNTQDGSVWYFGENVDNYEDGVLVNHHGAWIAGEGNAKPGIWIKENLVVGDSYRQEYLPGEAEDMSDVVEVGIDVSYELDGEKKSFSGCAIVLDWTPLDPDSREHKYYCSDVGALVMEKDLVEGNIGYLKSIIGPEAL